MNREEYLSELYGRLRQRMPGGELNNVMKYYEEYFNEAGPEREQDIMAELGTPEDLARQILSGRGAGSAPEYQNQQVIPRRWTTGKVVAVVLLSPLWLSLLVAIAGGMLGLVVGIGAGGLGCIAGGVFSGWCGFTALFTPGFTTTMFFGGLGILMVAFGLVMLAGSIALGRVMGKAVGSFCRWIFVGRKVWVQA